LRVISAHAKRMPDLLPAEPATEGMEPRDAALAHALIDASVRRWLTLSYIIEQAGGKDIRDMEARMQAALLVGAAQLLLFDRIPDHAAIDETVEWAKRRIRPGAGAMVNAILRRVVDARGERIDAWDGGTGAIPLSDGAALTLHGVTLPEEPGYRLVIACSLPGSLVESWKRLASGDVDAFVREQALHTLVHPPTVCFTADNPDLKADPRFVPHDAPGHSVFIGERADLGETLRRHPGVWVQDSAASEVVGSLVTEGEGVVVDLCAGRGTKTRQLLRAFPEARIVAAEVEDERLNTLRSVFGGHERVEVIHAEELRRRPPGGADLVLTDVPCSNSGVLARRTEARYRVRSEAMTRMVETQRTILRTAAAMVRPGGRVIYSTCSLEREENQEQGAWATQKLGLVIERERAVLPTGAPGGPAEHYRDGSYAVELRRPG
jgi:16S rRNA (cytosine967-C5)-methyltransferase